MYRRGVVVVVLSGVALVCGACSPAASDGGVDGSASPSGVDVSAKIDRDSWMIELPWDRYKLTEEEQNYLLSAGSMALAECTRTKLDGVAWTGFPPEVLMSVNPPVFSEFGPWRKEMAQQFGFTRVADSGKPIAGRGLQARSTENKEAFKQRSDSNSKMLEKAEKQIHSTCDSYPLVAKFAVKELDDSGPWKAELSNTRMVLFDDPRAKAIAGELDACFVKKGLKTSSETPGFVEGVDSFIEPTQETIGIALKAAECQEETDATPRLAQVWADLQAPIIKKYAKELVAQRRVIDERIAEAKKYIHDHPELLELPKE